MSGTRPSGRLRAVPSVVRIFGGINNGIQLPIAPPLHPPHPPQPQRFNQYRQRRTEGGGGGHQAGKDGEDAHGLCRIVMCLTRRYVTENRASQARAAPYGKIPSASLYLLVVCISIGTNTTYGLAIKTSKHKELTIRVIVDKLTYTAYSVVLKYYSKRRPSTINHEGLRCRRSLLHGLRSLRLRYVLQLARSALPSIGLPHLVMSKPSGRACIFTLK